MQEILNNSLPRNYRNELISKGWNNYKEPFQQAVDRLEVAELVFKAVAATAKSIADLKQYSSGGGGSCKPNHDGQEKVTCKKKYVFMAARSMQGYAEKRTADKAVLMEISLQISQRNKTYISNHLLLFKLRSHPNPARIVAVNPKAKIPWIGQKD